MQISAGDLSARAEELEVQLRRTFRVASNWKAVLLLDEADVYLQRRVQMRADHVRSALRANGYTIPAPGSVIDNSLYD
jgi:hypothetical protein